MDIGATVRVFRAEPLAVPGDPVRGPAHPPADGATIPDAPVPDGTPRQVPDRAGEPACAPR
ncbi:hypothetical protein ND486_00875 [Pseudonocardia sp. DR1-2]|uniref:hypothetical protein n=1 Tax=Pseudonocardia sp. DR1-2 TaxID=2951168 RepID=UPI002042C471|nr:hypothetical protein [Pseudonocardia sp. DR1-2]MCM3844747.1 hypothetical protein [Pseudonocardia sp. DR1-2]